MSRGSNKTPKKCLSDRVAEAAIDTTVKLVVGYVVVAALTPVVGPLAGFVAAKIATGGVSGPEDLL